MRFRHPVPDATKSGITLNVDKDMKAWREATVIKIGNIVISEDGENRHPHETAPGDVIKYQYRFGEDIGLDADGETLMLIHEDNISLII